MIIKVGGQKVLSFPFFISQSLNTTEIQTWTYYETLLGNQYSDSQKMGGFVIWPTSMATILARFNAMSEISTPFLPIVRSLSEWNLEQLWYYEHLSLFFGVSSQYSRKNWEIIHNIITVPSEPCTINLKSTSWFFSYLNNIHMPKLTLLAKSTEAPDRSNSLIMSIKPLLAAYKSGVVPSCNKHKDTKI